VGFFASEGRHLLNNEPKRSAIQTKRRSTKAQRHKHRQRLHSSWSSHFAVAQSRQTRSQPLGGTGATVEIAQPDEAHKFPA